MILGAERLDVLNRNRVKLIAEICAQIGCNRRYLRIAELLAIRWHSSAAIDDLIEHQIKLGKIWIACKRHANRTLSLCSMAGHATVRLVDLLAVDRILTIGNPM